MTEESTRASLLGVFVGRSAPLGPGNVPSAFVKKRSSGAVAVGVTGLEGDQQADLRVHGGPDMAIYAYPAEHYDLWRSEFPQHASLWGPGSLGENLALNGWNERDVCIGDTIRLGEVLLQVTRPRKPCFKLALRFNDLRLPRRLVESGRCGWYFRVLRVGSIAPHDEAELLQRVHPAWSIRRVNDISIATDVRLEELDALMALPELADNWRSQVRSMAAAMRAAAKSNAFRPFRVVAVHDESSTIKSFQLAPDDGGCLATALPGQHVVLRTREGESDQPRLRNYSLSAVANAQYLQISVKRAGTVSSRLHDGLKAGDCIDVLGPRGNFTLVNEDDRPVVLISAGVGITPMIPMLQAATTNNGGKIVPRNVLFIHGARNSSEHAFAAQIRDVIARHPAVTRHVRFSRPHPHDKPGDVHDSVGRIDRKLIAELLTPLGACDVFLCGPDGFMVDIAKWIGELGLSVIRVRTESFEAAAKLIDADSAARAPESAVVSFARTHSSAVWKRGEGSMLDVAERHGLKVASECRAGLCGMCVTRVISGRVGYDLEPVAPRAPDEMLLCCGYPVEETLVLDI